MTGFGEKLIRRFALIGLCAALGVAAAAPAGPALAQDQAPFQTTPEGLQYRDLKVGEGPAARLGDVAKINVIIWLDDNGARGRQIYSTREHGRAVSFVVGTDRVMEGWNQAVVGMRVGGRRLAMVPPQLAYGDRAVDDDIPARAFLIMIVELLALEQQAE